MSLMQRASKRPRETVSREIQVKLPSMYRKLSVKTKSFSVNHLCWTPDGPWYRWLDLDCSPWSRAHRVRVMKTWITEC